MITAPTKENKFGNRLHLVAYNAAWDYRHLKNWIKRARRDLSEFFYTPPICVMTLAAIRHGRFLSLREACLLEGIQLNKDRLHTATYDRELTERLYYKYAKNIRS
jgi:DNA polymerase III alpha subunit (gram-positive type)